MASFPEYDQFDGLGLAKLVRDGEINATELCEEAIRRAEDLNPKLNAIITPLYDYAREAAKHSQPDAPFDGVPFLLKDAHHALKGFALSYGSRLLKDFVSENDAEIVKRFKNAGLVILGKTNTSEFKLAYVTEPVAFGKTLNPWNLDCTPGGSSGGSAAAVAAGIVPLASATDEAGSIRVPASCCGLFGLKPSRGRNPVGPDFNEEWDGMSTSHVVTRSVRDSAAMLDAVSGPEKGAPYGIIAPERPFLEEVRFDPQHLRIGFHTRSAYGSEVHPECTKAVEKTCKLLENMGHIVEEAVPNYQEEDAVLSMCIIIIGNVTANVDRLIQKYGHSIVKQNIELPNYVMFRIGQQIKSLDFVKAKRRWRQFGTIMDLTLNNYDMVLTPTLGELPARAGSLQLSKSDQRFMKAISSWAGKIILSNRKFTFSIMEEFSKNMIKGLMPFTLIANITGQPAMSVPLHWTEESLPCGVQFIGRFGEDATLLRLAAQLERAQPWVGMKPKIR